MRNIVILLILFLFLLAACGVQRTNQDPTARSEYGYIRLAGYMANRLAYIDGNPVGVDPEYDANLIRVRAGTHRIEIRSHNRVLLSEEILVSAGETVEVTVP